MLAKLGLSITQVGFCVATIFCFIFVIVALIKRRHANELSKSFIAAALFNGVWLATVAFQGHIQANSTVEIGLAIWDTLGLVFIMETAHYSLWALALTKLSQRLKPNFIPRRVRVLIYSLALVIPVMTFALSTSKVFQENIIQALSWHSVIFALLNLLVIEQLYRSAATGRLIRLICICLGIMFLSDIALYSQHYTGIIQDEALWQARALFAILTFTLMTIGFLCFQGEPEIKSKVAISQPAVYFSMSLTTAGILLLILAFGSYYIKLKSASWLSILYSTLTIFAIFSITLALTSSKIRQRLNIFINKHLFNYKYDYRNEWLNLIRGLSQPVEHEKITEQAIRVSANLFRCNGAALFKLHNNEFYLSEQIGSLDNELGVAESAESEFVDHLRKGWVFAPNSISESASNHNGSLPNWLSDVDELWLICPLSIEQNLIGFMLLSHPKDGEQPNWEDFDLAKTVGRQVANYLIRHAQSELLAQARQFETFNKLSAFVMHDLKNLIAQQSLVVKNAEKHKDNPAFVEDAINTIKNSVDRMNTLLSKLKQNEPEETKVIAVKDLLIEATKRCQKYAPAPTLMDLKEALHVKADFDSLAMVFTHLIHNAQDATPDNGFVDIQSERVNSTARICIEDNGEGMTDEFIRNKLFQPFESTKAGKGMGVGVYQAREYIESLGGTIQVESQYGTGSKFTIEIPLAEA